MPRPPRFTDDDVLDAALSAVATYGPDVTITQISTALAGPVGSIYHRFGSRDDLLARLWIRCIGRFHRGLLDLDDAADPHAALLESARYVVTYCAEHPEESLGLRLQRQDRLVADTRISPEIREQARTINDDVDRVHRDLVQRHYGRADDTDLQRALLATRVVPYGIVRPWLGRDMPDGLAEAAVASADAILALG